MPQKKPADPAALQAPRRRRIPRWLLAVGALAGLFFVTLLAAPYFIPWDKVKAQVVEQGTKALGRELSIGSIDLGLLTGIHVKDVRLANARGGFSADPLFSNVDAKLSLSLWSLLSGRLVIDSIRFEKPSVLLETDRRGLSNLAGLGSASPASPAAPAAKASAASGGAFPVLVNEFIIDQGDVVLRDRRTGTETAIHGLDVKLTGISLAAAGDSRLQASLTAVVEGKAIPVKLDSDFRLDPAAGDLSIDSFQLTLPAVTARLKGTVKGMDQPQADLGLDVELALADLPGLLPPSLLKSLPPELKTGGRVALALKLKGPLKQAQALQVDGALNFEAVQAAYGSYPAVSGLQGTLTFDKAGAQLPALTMKLGGDPLTMAIKAHWGDLGNLAGGAAKLKADIKVSVSSPQLNLDPLLAASAGGPAPSAAAGTATPRASAGGGMRDLRASVPRGLTVSLDVDAATVSADGLRTGKLTERLRLAGQKLATATDLDLYQGHLSERSGVDLGQVGPVYRSQVQLQGLDWGPLVDDLAAANPKDATLQQLKGKLNGRVSLRADFHGKGLAEPARTQGLSGQASLRVIDGVIRRTDLQERLAAAIPDPQTQAVLRGDIPFANAIAEVVVAGPKTTLKSFNLGSGKDWRAGTLFLQASGTLVKDGPVDLRITPHFDPTQVRVGGGLGRALEDAKGWPTFDYIAYAGPTLDQAKADFSAGIQKAATKAVADQAQQLIQGKAGDALKKLFGQ